MPSNKFKQRNPRNKQTKNVLLFDEENRRDFLTGFQKRKKERKRVAREQQELKYKEEKQKLRQETRKALRAGWKELHFPDEDEKVQDAEQPVVFDHAEHTVTVQSVGGVTIQSMDLLAAHGGIGENKVEYEDEEDVREDAQSRLLEDNDEDEESSEDEEETVQDTPAQNSKNQAKRKSAKLVKLQSKLNKTKSGHKGKGSSRQKGGQKGVKSRGSTTNKPVSHRGKKQRGRGRGGHTGKRR